MPIGRHECSVERLWFDTLFKFIAGFAESRTCMTRSPERFQDNFAETLLSMFDFLLSGACSVACSNLVSMLMGEKRSLGKYVGRFYASFQSNFRGCY